MLRNLTLLVILLSTLSSSAQEHRLNLQSGTVYTIANLNAFAASQSPRDVIDGYYYRILQFNTIPDQAAKDRITASGVKLLQYLPEKAFVSAIPERYNRSLLADFDLYSVIQLLSIQKINKNILAGFPAWSINEKGTADVTLQYMRNISHERALQLASANGNILSSQSKNNTITLRINDQSLYSLAEQSWVYYVNAIEAPSFPEDTKGRSLHRSNTINTESSYVMGRKYNGDGIKVGLADDGFVGPHIDFTGRIVNFTSTTGQTHGDMTGGILAGGGNLNSERKGMGSGAFLYVYGISGYPHIVDAVNNYNTLGIVITSTSYSQGCNEYTATTELGDNLLNDNPQLEFVFSGGNSQSSDCNYGVGAGWGNITGGYKQGKNTIAVANLDAMEVLDNTSSRGPASDGRIKPDISSNGKDQMSTDENNTYQTGGGTSAACPGIAGILTQLEQAYKVLHGGAEPHGALMKACLLNGAEDIGNAGPDFTYGWGRVNALRAVKTIEENRFIYGSLSQNDSVTHQITVPAGTSELRVMVYWNDEGGSPIAATYLVNDLDITLTDASSAVTYPWILDHTPSVAALTSPATRGTDHLNNMEQVTVANPAAGNYDLKIKGFSIPNGPQDYYVVYEFRNDDVTVTYPFGGEGFVPGQSEMLRWDGSRSPGNYTIEFSPDNGNSWSTITNFATPSSQYYNWLVPANTQPTSEALIRVSRNGNTDVSDTTFTIIGVPSNINVSWACPDSMRLTWNAVAGATGYTVYRLGAKYMDVAGTTTTTDIILHGINAMDEQWFSVSAQINGSNGRRSVAFQKNPGLINCSLLNDGVLTSVNSPSPGSVSDCQNVSALPVSISYSNAGMNTAANIPVSYMLDSNVPVNETIPGPVNAGAQVNYTFNTTADFSAIGNHTLKVWSSLPNDQNLFNDTVIIAVNTVASVLQTLPVSENFDAFTICSTTSNCGLTNCSTGVKWKNLVNVTEDDIDFRVYNAGTPSAGTGPDFDHTTGSANFIYLEASGTCANETAILMGECIDLHNTIMPQLSFYYHMYGTDMGELHVDVFSEGAWVNDIINPITGDQGNQWLNQNISLNAYIDKVINVRFRGITGNNYASDLALDDISLTATVSVNETSAYPELQVYPNPSDGYFTIQKSDGIKEILNYTVTDLQGRIITEGDFNPMNQHGIDLQRKSKGLYLLNIKGAEGQRTIRLNVI